MRYADSGVDRNVRERAKLGVSVFGSAGFKTPFNALVPVDSKSYYSFCTDGVGTKCMVAQLADKHGGIGIDAVAMVANDTIRCGARPAALVDVIDIRKTEEHLLRVLLRSIAEGARQAECAVVGGETADLGEMVGGVGANPYNVNCSCVGFVGKKDVVLGNKLKAGDVVIGLRSSGIHSNGFSLVRRALFSQWGGRFNAHDKPEALKGKTVAEECLKPTRIYVKSVLKAMKNADVKAAVHITGDAYVKFDKLFAFSKGVGIRFDNFKPQPIFALVQECGKVPGDEMLKTFNMGWGFALIAPKKEEDKLLSLLKNEGAEKIGEITAKAGVVEAFWKNKHITLKR
ncbi:phosphoribosylformylglycinamidine cyclo-ligase [Candidatus Micrarchaeota archaeon CG08_land_8_20_14_0_20_59_11]|nr:MAG: phosphoribosylformylglycinamidine cyclo-ligase [Candidatus Micrarchaeota archaeon CG08_land_8_20_14_0_20_59_11]PIT85576.1 MAG: phosphoribosylformylglycinamidine cyclo-ligase [Candidatus Micrarchaeota archaeon CG10_big_fil_rev_8_21_14_0_10_59_7]